MNSKKLNFVLIVMFFLFISIAIIYYKFNEIIAFDAAEVDGVPQSKIDQLELKKKVANHLPYSNKPNCRNKISLDSLANTEKKFENRINNSVNANNSGNTRESAFIEDYDNPISIHMFFENCNVENIIFNSNYDAKIQNNDKFIQFCKNIPLEKKFKPIDWFNKLSKNSDAFAKLIYALHAEKIVNIIRFKGEKDADLLIREILKNAETFGAEAAAYGYDEAYWYMSRAYTIGLFGKIDPELAYFYTDQLTRQYPTEENRERLYYLKKFLSPQQIHELEATQNNCSSDVNSASGWMRSPF